MLVCYVASMYSECEWKEILKVAIIALTKSGDILISHIPLNDAIMSLT